MAGSMTNLYDDFGLPGIDRSKWDYNVATNVTMIKGQGMRITAPTTGIRHGITSRDTYNMTGSGVSIRIDETPTGLTTDSTFFISWDTDLSRYQWVIYTSAGVKKIKAEKYGSAAAITDPSGGAYDVVYSPTAHKYIRFSNSVADSLVRWQTSADGINWTTRATHTIASFPITAVRVNILCGDGIGGYLQVRRLSTNVDINRGSGFLYETWSSYPLMTIPAYVTTPSQQFGQWANLTGTQSIIQSPDNPSPGNSVLRIVATTGATATALAKSWSTIKDLDFTAQVMIFSQSTSPSSRLVWRVDSTEANYWYLKITTTAVTPGYFSGGTDHDLTPITVALDLGKFYTFRVVHVGSEVVIFLDGGAGTAYGAGLYGVGGYGGWLYGMPTEIGRFSNANVTNFGTVGFKATSSTMYYQKTQVVVGVTPPSTPSVVPAEATQIKPWTGTRIAAASKYEYLYLEDDFGNSLNLLPSYGDIVLRSADLGSPSARTVQRERPLGNGIRSYTRFHGEKPVSLSLSCYKTAYQEARYYVELLQRWAAPGKRSRLVYKPRGAGERYINIEGSTLGAVTATAVTNQKIQVEVGFVAVDGGDYESVEKSVGLVPDVSADAVNYGSLQTEPVIRFYGPSLNPVLYHETIEANNPGKFARIGLALEIPTGDFIELDAKERTVQWKGLPDASASRRQYLTTRDWFIIETLRNSLRYTSEDVSGTAVVIWHDKY